MPLSPNLRARLSKVCVALTGQSADELITRARAVLSETTFLEFRLDYLPDPRQAIAPLQQFLTATPTITAIATCRRIPDGGHFTGSPADELDILTLAASSNFRIVDLPITSASALDLSGLRSTGVAVLISHHDFEATGDLDTILEQALQLQPDLVKIVPTAQTLSDNLTLIRFLERNADRTALVGISMGESGLISRVLGIRAGSLFTFAAATAGEETAPGQIAANTLLDTYRLQELDAATRIYGVAGNPVQHSLSPAMLNAAFHREKLDAVYLPLPTSSLDDLLKLVRGIPLQGMSVTMPFKQTILPHLDRTDALTSKIGACNTVLRAPDGKLLGFNTDVAGIVLPLEKRLGSLRGLRALVLGAGGAARAAVFGLRDKGADVSILNRTPAAAQKLARQADARTVKRDLLRKEDFDVIINATPLGMTGHEAVSPLAAEELRTRLVFDLVYNPLETPLLRLARQGGLTVITGAEMFVRQGARQFEIWTGRPAPEDEMFRIVLHALGQRQSRSPAPSVDHPNSPATATQGTVFDASVSADPSLPGVPSNTLDQSLQERQPATRPTHAKAAKSSNRAARSTVQSVKEPKRRAS